MCLEVTPGITDQRVTTGRSASPNMHVDGPTQVPTWTALKEGSFQRYERHLGFRFNIKYPYVYRSTVDTPWVCLYPREYRLFAPVLTLES